MSKVVWSVEGDEASVSIDKGLLNDGKLIFDAEELSQFFCPNMLGKGRAISLIFMFKDDAHGYRVKLSHHAGPRPYCLSWNEVFTTKLNALFPNWGERLNREPDCYCDQRPQLIFSKTDVGNDFIVSTVPVDLAELDQQSMLSIDDVNLSAAQFKVANWMAEGVGSRNIQDIVAVFNQYKWEGMGFAMDLDSVSEYLESLLISAEPEAEPEPVEEPPATEDIEPVEPPEEEELVEQPVDVIPAYSKTEVYGSDRPLNTLVLQTEEQYKILGQVMAAFPERASCVELLALSFDDIMAADGLGKTTAQNFDELKPAIIYNLNHPFPTDILEHGKINYAYLTADELKLLTAKFRDKNSKRVKGVPVAEVMNTFYLDYKEERGIGRESLRALLSLQNKLLTEALSLQGKEPSLAQIQLIVPFREKGLDGRQNKSIESSILNGIERFIAQKNKSKEIVLKSRWGWGVPQRTLEDVATGSEFVEANGTKVTRERIRQIQERQESIFLLSLPYSQEDFRDWLEKKTLLSIASLFPGLKGRFAHEDAYLEFLAMLMGAPMSHFKQLIHPIIRKSDYIQLFTARGPYLKMKDVEKWVSQTYGWSRERTLLYLEEALRQEKLVAVKGCYKVTKCAKQEAVSMVMAPLSHALHHKQIALKANELKVCDEFNTDKKDPAIYNCTDVYCTDVQKGTYAHVSTLSLGDLKKRIKDLRDYLELKGGVTSTEAYAKARKLDPLEVIKVRYIVGQLDHTSGIRRKWRTGEYDIWLESVEEQAEKLIRTSKELVSVKSVVQQSKGQLDKVLAKTVIEKMEEKGELLKKGKGSTYYPEESLEVVNSKVAQEIGEFIKDVLRYANRPYDSSRLIELIKTELHTSEKLQKSDNYYRWLLRQKNWCSGVVRNGTLFALKGQCPEKNLREVCEEAWEQTNRSLDQSYNYVLARVHATREAVLSLFAQLEQ